ncbi:MAG TPA: zinc ABC transporter substrate-binding protein [Candidatus Saccharimonadales bacterium]|nr:zinc ABC transporter substrate-binding protein [Candidatus Saccharimonadales bacterium]
MKTYKLPLLILIFVAAVLSIVYFTTTHKQSTQKLSVAASFYPLYEFAQRVGGEKIEVSNLTPAGVEPHEYEPSPKTLADIQKSQLLLFVGGTLEPWAEKFLPQYGNTAVRVDSNIDTIQTDEGKDPHFWLDPTYAKQIVSTIRDALAKADPANKSYYEYNAALYISELDSLAADFANGLKTCDQRFIVTSHEAFSYVAKRYSLQVAAIAGLSTESEPDPSKMALITNMVKDKGLKYIFFETLVSPRLADTIAQETGAKTAVFDPIEGLSDENKQQGKNYISIQRENLAALRTALGCK